MNNFLYVGIEFGHHKHHMHTQHGDSDEQVEHTGHDVKLLEDSCPWKAEEQKHPSQIARPICIPNAEVVLGEQCHETHYNSYHCLKSYQSVQHTVVGAAVRLSDTQQPNDYQNSRQHHINSIDSPKYFSIQYFICALGEENREQINDEEGCENWLSYCYYHSAAAGAAYLGDQQCHDSLQSQLQETQTATEGARDWLVHRRIHPYYNTYLYLHYLLPLQCTYQCGISIIYQLTDMKKQQLNLDDYTKHTNQILTWLESVAKSKSSPRSSLQQQLQTLSHSYKNAQEKLLSLEKQVYYECLHNEKQRSIIQILKYIINGNLDDETILSYLVEIQDQSTGQLESKYQIKTELQQIKEMVLKRKGNNKKQQSMAKVAISELKKQIAKCNHVKRQLMEDLDKAINQKQKLQLTIQQQKIQIQKQVTLRLQFIQQIESLKTQNLTLYSQKQFALQQKYINQQKQQTYQQLLTQLKSILNAQNKNEVENVQGFAGLLKQFKKVQQKLQKYRNFSKELTEKLKINNKNAELITTLKLFLPQDALKLCEQFEINEDKFLLKQIQGIAKLEKKKLHKLQNCQTQVWRLKSKLLKEGETVNNKYGKTNFKSSVSLASDNKQNQEPNSKVAQQITEFREKD